MTTSPTPEPRPEPTTVPWPPTTTSGHPSVEILCRSSYYTDTGKRQDPGSRIVRCGLPYGHDGDHDEMIDGEPGNSWPQTPAGPTGRPPRADTPALVDGQRVLIEAEVCAGGTRIHTIRPQQSGTIAYLDLAEVVLHLEPPVRAILDRIDVTAAELRRQIDTIAGALNDGAPGWSQAMAAENARLRSQLAEARQQRDQAAEALAAAETERDEARADVAALRRGARGWRDRARAAEDRCRVLVDEIDRHIGQHDCGSYGACLARIRDRAQALAATAPETGPTAPQTGEQAETRADTHTGAETGSQGPLDLDAIRARWLHPCGPCDAGYPTGCTCPPGDPRTVIAALADEIDRLRDLLDEAAREIDERDKLLDIADKTELEAP